MILLRHICLTLLLLPGLQSFGTTIDTVFNSYFHQDVGGWIAGDATFSIYLPDGRTLWLFGDSFIGEVNPDNSIAPGAKMIRNSAVLQDGETFTTLTGGTSSAPQTFIPTDHPDSTWYWPEHGIAQNDTLYIFLSKFRENGGPAGFNFEFVSNDVAMFALPSLKFYGTIELPWYPYNKVIYGDRVLEDGGYLYIYGRKVENPDYNIPYPYLARAVAGNLTGPWEFHSSSGWSTDPAASTRINDFQVSQEYAVIKHQGRFILITQDIWFSTKIWSFTSGSPDGPWTNKKLLYSTPLPYETMVTYNAYAHPQFDRHDELLVSYNSNGDFLKIFGNVDLYKPRFIRVPYADIDQDFQTGIDPSRNRTDEESIDVWPNPCASEVNFTLTLSRPGPVRITVFDLTGRQQAVFRTDWRPAGKQRISVPVTSLPEGMYFYRAEAPGYSLAGRFVKTGEIR